MDNKIIDIEKITNEKWMNLYRIKYKTWDYLLASRKPIDRLVVTTKKVSTDGVRILPYFEKNGKTYVIFIKEYRNPLDKYIYAVPAGLVNYAEEPMQSAIREVEEEIGASVKKIEKISCNLFSSPGMIDESLILYKAEVVLDKRQELEPTEDISIKIVALEDIPKFLDQPDFCMASYLMAQIFYYQEMSKINSNS